jgi:uncharacterized protein (TIGR03790 family)
VVYTTNDADSVAVANHYRGARGVPAANMCAITLPLPGATQLAEADYVTYVKTPLRNCLTSVGAQNILYIVLAYLRPVEINSTANFVYGFDSFLADIWDQYTTRHMNPPSITHGYYGDSQSQGNVFAPFQSLADFRASGRSQLIYSVWRLDGAAAAIATGEVDSVLAAEAAGGSPLSQISGSPGNACVDQRSVPTGIPDSGYTTADWDLFRAAQFLQTANNLNVVVDRLGTSFGVAPSPSCLNTSLYVGWYNYGTYNDGFSWNRGSIGWDLDSGALFDPRQGTWWGTGALSRGISVTSGAITEPFLGGLPRPAVMRNLLEGANVGDAFLRNTRWLKWRIMNVGDPLYRPFPGGVAPFNAPLRLKSLSFYQGQVYFRQFLGGSSIAAAISLDAPAPANGLTVNLTADNASVALPASVTIPAGQTSVAFYLASSIVTAPTDVQVTASAGPFSATNTVSLIPLLIGPAFPLNPLQNGVASEAKGGTTVAALMTLNASAPLGGIAVEISSDQPDIAAVPNSITVPAGLSQVAFMIPTTAVTANSPVTFTSSYGGKTNKISLILTP